MVANFFLQLGLLELAALTWLFPGAALFFAGSPKPLDSGIAADHPLPRKLEILIPAHDDAPVIAETVSRLRRQVDAVLPGYPGVRISIHVGADDCRDETAKIAFRSGAKVSVFSDLRSRWKTLKALVDASEADWIIVADPTIRWGDEFLSDVLSHGVCGAILALDPSRGAGPLGKLEDHLRELENRVGGPIGFRAGAWVFEATVLRSTLQAMSSRDWYSLGSVIPLALRLKHPQSRTLAQPRLDASEGSLDLKSRFREMMGELQWIRLLLPHALNQNPRVGLLALRRAAQVFWVYGWLFTFLGIVLQSSLLAILMSAALVGIGAGFLARGGLAIRTFRDAAIVSLAAPLLWFKAGSASQIRWK